MNKNKIYEHDLFYKDAPVHFVIKTMEEVDAELGGIADYPHRHQYYSVIWSFTATGRHIIDFREYPIAPNNIFFVNPEQVHQVITNPKPTGYLILFTPEFLEKNSISRDFISNLKLFNKSDETPPLPLDDKLTNTLKFFAEKMLTAFHSKNHMYIEIIGAYLKLFLIECNSNYMLSVDGNTQYIEVEKTLQKSFRELVDKQFMQWHQVKSYAEALFVTPNYLNEVISSSTYISAKDFIQKRIIVEAKRLLYFTDKSAKEIGYELGFEDPSHFSKFFKTQTGQSLQDFKKSAGK